MESRKTIAIEKHNLGYNCAQSVALTYADLVDIAPEQLSYQPPVQLVVYYQPS